MLLVFLALRWCRRTTEGGTGCTANSVSAEPAIGQFLPKSTQKRVCNILGFPTEHFFKTCSDALMIHFTVYFAFHGTGAMFRSHVFEYTKAKMNWLALCCVLSCKNLTMYTAAWLFAVSPIYAEENHVKGD